VSVDSVAAVVRSKAATRHVEVHVASNSVEDLHEQLRSVREQAWLLIGDLYTLATREYIYGRYAVSTIIAILFRSREHFGRTQHQRRAHETEAVRVVSRNTSANLLACLLIALVAIE